MEAMARAIRVRRRKLADLGVAARGHGSAIWVRQLDSGATVEARRPGNGGAEAMAVRFGAQRLDSGAAAEARRPSPTCGSVMPGAWPELAHQGSSTPSAATARMESLQCTGSGRAPSRRRTSCSITSPAPHFSLLPVACRSFSPALECIQRREESQF